MTVIRWQIHSWPRLLLSGQWTRSSALHWKYSETSNYEDSSHLQTVTWKASKENKI